MKVLKNISHGRHDTYNSRNESSKEYIPWKTRRDRRERVPCMATFFCQMDPNAGTVGSPFHDHFFLSNGP